LQKPRQSTRTRNKGCSLILTDARPKSCWQEPRQSTKLCRAGCRQCRRKPKTARLWPVQPLAQGGLRNARLRPDMGTQLGLLWRRRLTHDARPKRCWHEPGLNMRRCRKDCSRRRRNRRCPQVLLLPQVMHRHQRMRCKHDIQPRAGQIQERERVSRRRLTHTRSSHLQMWHCQRTTPMQGLPFLRHQPT